MRKLNIKIGFLFLCLLIATLYSTSLAQFIAWIAVIFGSIVFHELGHALTAAAFGKKATIELSFVGGTTYFPQEGLKKWQLFFIALNGPVFGFVLFLAATFAQTKFGVGSTGAYVCQITGAINFFWTLFNLLPILPLDGGQLLRIIFEAIFKNKGLFFSSLLSIVISTIMALVAFLIGQYFIGSVLFLFSFQNFELVKQTRYLTSADREDSLRKLLQDGIFLFETGSFEKAKPVFEELRLKSKKGMLFTQATAMLALIMKSKNDYAGVYLFLKPYPKLYETDLAAVMHEAAFFQGDMDLVSKLSAEAFQKESSKDVAYHAAIAAAFFHQEEATIGWLKTALELGLNEDEIKGHPVICAYLDRVRS